MKKLILQNIPKSIFVFLTITTFLLLPIMSLDSGISGDEYAWHNPHGEKVINYFATLGKDRTTVQKDYIMRLYPNLFSNLAVGINEIFNIENIYESRHVTCVLTAWLLLLFCGLIIKEIFNWEAAVLAFILGFLTPKIIGHGFNNTTDAPFAFTFAFTYYYFIKLVQYLPKIKIKYAVLSAVGIGLAIGSRVGGLLLIPYLFLLIGLIYLNVNNNNFKSIFRRDKFAEIFKLFGYAIAISIGGYIVGILFWPYCLENPISGIIETLAKQKHYSTSLAQIYNGEKITSSLLPWHYLPKLILITTPVVILLGFVLSFVTLKHYKSNTKRVYLWFFFLFVTIFPVAYIIYSKSNVYGCIRHVLFILPSMVIIATIGYYEIWTLIKHNKIFRYISLSIFATLCFFPLKHYIVNHPYEYIYFNVASGGMENAYGYYETDYYMHSVREGVKWLKDNEINETDTVNICSNHSSTVSYYTRHERGRLTASYARYYQRSEKLWDYYICVNTTIEPSQLRNKTWPPANTIHTIDVDGYPICAIIKRKSKKDYEGFQALKKNNLYEAYTCFNEYLQTDSNNTNVLNAKLRILSSENKLQEAINVGDRIFKAYPNNIVTEYYLGRIYFNTRQYQKALGYIESSLQISNDKLNSYYLLGICLLNLHQEQKALKYLNHCANNKYKPAINILIRYYKQIGNTDYVNKLKVYLKQL